MLGEGRYVTTEAVPVGVPTYLEWEEENLGVGKAMQGLAL